MDITQECHGDLRPLTLLYPYNGLDLDKFLFLLKYGKTVQCFLETQNSGANFNPVHLLSNLKPLPESLLTFLPYFSVFFPFWFLDSLHSVHGCWLLHVKSSVLGVSPVHYASWLWPLQYCGLREQDRRLGKEGVTMGTEDTLLSRM